MYRQYKDLANAIIVRAVRDYKKTLLELQEDPNNDLLAYEKKSIEEFFFSDWFVCLSDADPYYIIQQINEMVA